MAETAFELDVSINGKRFRNAALGMRLLADRWDTAITGMTPIARREMVSILDTVTQALRQRHSSRWSANRRLPEGAERGKLAKRSGGGLRGLRTKVSVSGDDVTGSLSVPFPLSVHEDGAVIRRRGKLLAIPLPAALNSRGLPIKNRPRDWTNTFVAESKRGNLLIFRRDGRTIVPLYILKEQTRIPRRLGAGVTLNKAAPLYIERVFEEALKVIQSASQV